MSVPIHLLGILLTGIALASCDSGMPGAPGSGEMGGEAEASEERGPNGGRMLRDGDFAVELAVFETGVPPEFRAWVTDNGRPVAPGAVDLTVELERLDAVDRITFTPAGNFLRSEQTIYEPHSFVVTLEAGHDGETHRWQYDSIEGRTEIGPEMADAFGLATMKAGPAVLNQTLTLYGRIAPDTGRVRDVSARFEGAIQSVAVALGDTVSQGETLATVESNESLRSYTIDAPIAGVVTMRAANTGEQTAGRRLFRIVDMSEVWAELSVFLRDRPRVRSGAPVTLVPTTGGLSVEGTISYVGVVAESNQSVTARVVLDNGDGAWALGTFVTAEVVVVEQEVPLAVRRSALQTFRDFTVAYAKVGDQYEVRMLELGRRDAEWAEVLGGLDPGTEYVTENSYVLKADIEKSGATHDH